VWALEGDELLVKSPFSKERRAIWSRRIKGFWEEYRHNKIGLFGLAVVLFYVLVAFLAPWLTPYDPIGERFIASGFAIPEWVPTLFPQYRDLPRTMEPPINWTIGEESEFITVIESGAQNIVLNYTGDATETVQSINFIAAFWYPYGPNDKFTVTFEWDAENVADVEYSLELSILNAANNPFPLWTMPFTRENSTLVPVTELRTGEDIAGKIFNEKGEYELRFQMSFRSASDDGTATIQVIHTNFKIFGRVHGLLGTDKVGRDVFSQLVYGVRISLAVGLLAGFLSTTIGISVGIISGYTGGFVDEGLMRMVDVLLCLPVLPLLLGLMRIFGTSVWYLVLLIAMFGWLGLSRMVRSQVLSLKEMPFIECARAAGASKFYIMVRHVLPNILPIALAAMVLAVPAAILTEAAISFIGLGDPATPTWGRMLNYAFRLGGFVRLAWWWILPPGLAITLLTLSFVFIGHAVDEIVNPRLRRRR